MQRREHQYSASLQTRKSTTLSCTVNGNLLEEESDESNDPQATMDRKVEERDKQNDDTQGATYPENDEQSAEGSLCSGINNTDQPSITCTNCESNLELLQTMRETILSQQDLIQNLSGFVAADQHQQIQTISSQAEFISTLQASLRQLKLSPAAKLKGDDEQTRFYTGLSSYALFSSLSDLLASVCKKQNINQGLSVDDQFLLVLMKLRTGFPNKELAYRFEISPGRVSQIFHEWIDMMARELNQLIVWPDRQMIRKTLPDCFKALYARATCIIDCSEIFIERATSLSARSELIVTIKVTTQPNFLLP